MWWISFRFCWTDVSDFLTLEKLMLINVDDQEFCKYPITIDLDINPFRYRRETSRGSKHLFHAIIALACHHRKDYRQDKAPPLEFYEHKNHSMVLYKEALQSSHIQHQSLPALDTLLALWCIDVRLPPLSRPQSLSLLNANASS